MEFKNQIFFSYFLYLSHWCMCWLCIVFHYFYHFLFLLSNLLFPTGVQFVFHSTHDMVMVVLLTFVWDHSLFFWRTILFPLCLSVSQPLSHWHHVSDFKKSCVISCVPCGQTSLNEMLIHEKFCLLKSIFWECFSLLSVHCLPSQDVNSH